MIKKFKEFFPRELLKMFRRIPLVWFTRSFFIISSDVIKKITFCGICELSLVWFEMHKWKLSSRSKSSPDVSSQLLFSGQLFVLTTLIFLIVASLFQFSSSRREKIAKSLLKSEQNYRSKYAITFFKQKMTRIALNFNEIWLLKRTHLNELLVAVVAVVKSQQMYTKSKIVTYEMHLMIEDININVRGFIDKIKS